MTFALTPWRSQPPPRYVTERLWRTAGRVPIVDFQFGQNSSLNDAVSGRNDILAFTRPSTDLVWNGSTYATAAINTPAYAVHPQTGRRGLRLQSGRTNLATLSSDLSTGVWGTAPNLSRNLGSAELGFPAKTTLTRIANTTQNFVGTSFTGFTGAVTFYVIARRETASSQLGLRLQLPDFANRANASFTLAPGAGVLKAAADQTGTVTGATSGIVELINNSGIFLCWLTATSATTSTSSVVAGPTSPDVSASGWEAASATLSGVTILHAQIEASGGPSSPVITTGTTAARSADVLTFADLSWWPTNGEWTTVCEWIGVPDGSTNKFMYGFDRGAIDVDEIRAFQTAALNGFTISMSNPSGVTDFNITTSSITILDTVARVVHPVALNNSNRFANGNAGTLDTTVTPPNPPTRGRFGRRANDTFFPPFPMIITRWALFQGRIADNIAQAMSIP